MFWNLRNSIDFLLRQHVHISRKNYKENNEDKNSLDFTKSELELESLLLNKYNFYYYKNNSTIPNYCQNLYILNLLDKYLSPVKNEKFSILDVGSKNWYYVQAEYSYFKKYCNELNLDGVEIDAYRLYSNFYNRFEVAKYYINNLQGVNYIPNDVMNINKQYDYIIWILPFVLIEPHRFWGLPDRYFNPEKLFEHVYLLLKKNGKMLIINQGEEEFNTQKNIMSGLKYESLLLDNMFYKYKHERYLSIIEKE